jgi:hypothetical protein
METGTLRLVTWTFILSLLFPVFAFAFTNFGVAFDTYDISVSLDQDSLINAGIILKEGISHNVTFRGGYVEYVLQNLTVRVAWIRQLITGDYFFHYRQSFVGGVLNNWLFTRGLSPKIGTDTLNFDGMKNATVINNFDTEYNWTKYKIVETGLTAFITTIPSDQNNITQAIQDTGMVTLTLGKQISQQEEFTFTSFVDWYWSIILGANDWGMPSFMSFLMRLISALTFLSAILLVKDLLPF